MYIEALERHLAVCSIEGAARLVSSDRKYWNVVSICGPRDLKPDLRQAKRVHFSCFDDVEDACSAIYRSPKAADVAEIFGFIRSLESVHAPLLIHCQQGLSRSAAIALSWIYGQLPACGNRPQSAIELLLQLRPQAKPNRLVLALGLGQSMPVTQAAELAASMIAEPRLARNRFHRTEPG